MRTKVLFTKLISSELLEKEFGTDVEVVCKPTLQIDLTSKIPGRVVSLYVKEGDTVQKGQVIARIDTRDLEAQLNQNLANIAAIQAQQNQIRLLNYCLPQLQANFASEKVY